jgi:alpha-glucosidase
VLQRIRALLDEYPGTMSVGEVGDTPARQIDVMALYSSGGDKLHMAYSFEFLTPDHSAAHFRDAITRFQRGAPDGWACWSFSNHDVPRHASRWTRRGATWRRSRGRASRCFARCPARWASTKGEEMGQVETDIEFHELRGPGLHRLLAREQGTRRLPHPHGLGARADQRGLLHGLPWLPVKEPQAARAVDLQEARNDSVLHSYRATLAFRKATDALRLGDTAFLDLPEPLLGLSRSHAGTVVTALFNLSERPRTLALSADARAVGPARAELEGQRLALPRPRLRLSRVLRALAATVEAA